MEYYTLKLLGLTRKLPLMYVGKRTRLANLTVLGDVELVKKLADVLTAKLRAYDLDCVVGPQIKIVPLVHGIALRLGHKRFVVCRKTIKPYMVNPLILKPDSHVPKHIKQLVINGTDVQFLKNKRVALIDDVVSTGVTMRLLHKLMDKVGARVIVNVTIIRQGEQLTPIKDLIYLGELPIFT
ncbi:MAG: Phosphoribosyl transferase domain protein [Candidatus Gottesmanbacteria bacterium GW2011_GWB1_43_11]|uniref:Phosphoribosyl transferase domain protein n=1 Tax=Candidatus Gottesmanbacteria bacterium GW2011_GWB1_43_11 TaxID=1618446 RepID=A0A0G1CKL2_9BACT|nr:MAG: Phosphoribosyl transferase domain protein [Candidatus Gottesmanbacteria bacterium GW2011_GWA2_42_16]KKS55788.1 MAG: Phosphoribosyl transferase domain protein [Candidatus Gottesmanbacteria bacterium GW2011_GWA1_42_26]KKS81996.1 MAG: Phosphoribosyl transferase domain protein [Candidatus Gottesmanbacteria bacterium GW2011_GWC1_43_10]KKS86355.1 MAG: Phosphoribosyl transferase domain protein [Candidatus Gottesmanbacteria bacterium GW2011_GWB1_43_11]OGG09776.1 MAG: hypothetical protein A2699_